MLDRAVLLLIGEGEPVVARSDGLEVNVLEAVKLKVLLQFLLRCGVVDIGKHRHVYRIERHIDNVEISGIVRRAAEPFVMDADVFARGVRDRRQDPGIEVECVGIAGHAFGKIGIRRRIGRFRCFRPVGSVLDGLRRLLRVLLRRVSGRFAVLRRL